MNGMNGDFGVFKWKVENPHISNNITQMKSGGFQPPFVAGGNQAAYYLGMNGNTNTNPGPVKEGEFSAYKKVLWQQGQHR